MKTKSVDQQIKECVKKISDDDIKFLSVRLSQRFGGDIGEALVLIQDNYPELNKLLISMPSCNDLYNLVDIIDRHIQETVSKKPPMLIK